MRVYAIRYKEYDAKGGAYKYADTPEYTLKREVFTRRERDKFIERYEYLTSEGEMYYDDIECFVGELHLIEDMQAVVDAI